MTVHPRVCGEQPAGAAEIAAEIGSSPRVRGTDRLSGVGVLVARFIPACAGNRDFHPVKYFQKTVHPRVCGEQLVVRRLPTVSLGSSPRVRGTERQGRQQTGESRFIPACAGNRRPGIPLRRPPPVHPRVCGEQRAGVDRAIAEGGSSPRVRGTAD